MCKGKCKCNEEVTAVRNKVNRMVDEALTALEAKAQQSAVDVDAEVATIDKKLFSGIAGKGLSGKALRELLVNEQGMLTLDKLMEREDVQGALKQTQEVYTNAFQYAIEVGGKLSEAETKINDLAEIIMEDVIIFGITDTVRDNIVSLEGQIADILSEI